MSFLSKFIKKKNDNANTGGMEDYMNLIRVYFQASIAANVGITNLAMLPDLRVFKSTLHVPTVNNKLGVGEKKHCMKMLMDLYGIDDEFDIWYDDVVTDVDYLLMNWGYDGIYDDGTYSSNANLSWEDRNENGNTRPYIYKREIYYDFR